MSIFLTYFIKSLIEVSFYVTLFFFSVCIQLFPLLYDCFNVLLLFQLEVLSLLHFSHKALLRSLKKKEDLMSSRKTRKPHDLFNLPDKVVLRIVDLRSSSIASTGVTITRGSLSGSTPFLM